MDNEPYQYYYEEEEKELDKMKDNIVPMFGNKGTGGNWLADLELGTMFLIQERAPSADFNCGRFVLINRTEKACVLASSLVQQEMFVNPVRFCAKYDLFEELGVIKSEDIGEEELLTPGISNVPDTIVSDKEEDQVKSLTPVINTDNKKD